MAKSSQPRKRLIGKDILISCLLAVSLIYVFTKVESLQNNIDNLHSISYNKKDAEIKFGFNLQDFFMEAAEIKKGDILGSLLYYQGVKNQTINELETKSKELAFNSKSIRPGKKLYFIKEDPCAEPIALVYEPSNMEYVVYDFREGVDIKLVEKEVETCLEVTSGRITGSLWNSLKENNVDVRIIDKMEDALASNVDFYHTQIGDEFKLIYEKRIVDGQEVGIGNLIG
ncbi:MAG TPA: hypothetical protein PLY70_20520, partial [Saprospiraceae bacterium]|nr:hypothetical protein [Saprospiraceae bacterium]